MHIYNVPFFFRIIITEAPKRLVHEYIQPRLMYSCNQFQISANSSSLIWYSWTLSGYLYLSIRSILCLVLLSTRQPSLFKHICIAIRQIFLMICFVCRYFASISLSCDFRCSSKIGDANYLWVWEQEYMFESRVSSSALNV